MADRVARPRSEIGPVDVFLARADALLAENDRERVSDTTVLKPEVSDTSKAVQVWSPS